jgi:hypothetical protein
VIRSLRKDTTVLIPDDTRQALRQIAQGCDCLIFGELHGTQEVPQLLTGLLDDLSAAGYGALAMELPESEREPIMAWASGETDALPSFFTVPPTDGRNNEQALHLFRQVVGRGWQILCFDTEDAEEWQTWQSRDRALAENLTEQWAQICPDRKVVAVCGDLHSRLTPLDPFMDLWPSFAAGVRERHPQRVVQSIDLVFHAGSFFNNNQVNELHATPFHRIELEDGVKRGHTYILHLPHATAATFLASQVIE